jgi:hypothetical protein
MARYEKLCLGSAAMIAAAYLGFCAGMIEGGALAPRGAGEILRLLFGLFALLAIGHAGLWIALARQGSTLPDECEAGIAASADRAGYFGAEAGIAALALLAMADMSGLDALGSFAPTSPQRLIFALVTISMLVALGRLLLAVGLARRVGA